MELRKVDYKDWFINSGRIPSPDSQEYKDFFDFHKELCINGCMVGDIYINPFLYWHLNFWHIDLDTIDSRGRIGQAYANPPLRDNEWIITNEITRAENEKKGLIILGIRRLAKSVLAASYMGLGATFDQNSQNVIAGINSQDIKLITDKLDKGLNFLPEAWQWDRVEDNWKTQVTLGIKLGSGKRIPFSQILIRNLDEGANEEAIAGTKPRRLLIDEALEENELVYTEEGSVKIKDIQIGDFIFDDQGVLTKILEKNRFENEDLCRITLSDGREIVSTSNHIWYVFNTVKNIYEEKTTVELLSKYYYNKQGYKSLIYSIPNNKSLEYTIKNLKIDPYLLGLWLGDGNSSSCLYFTNIDQDIIDYLEFESEIQGLNFRKLDSKHYTLGGFGKGKQTDLSKEFNKFNLINNKHIPDIYLRSSFMQRLELLQGLMDTDGSCSKDGGLEFSTVYPRLAESFYTLVRSLGISISRSEKIGSYKDKDRNKINCKLVYRFSLFTELPIFKLQRKLDNMNKSSNLKKKAYLERSTISKIEKVGKGTAYCIKVDNESKLFLTTNFTVTHNCGKGNFLRGLQAAEPGFTTPYGWGCSPIITGTGGDMQKFADAKSLMFDTDKFNFLSYKNDDDTKRIHGLFIGAKYRLEAKEDSTLDEYLGKELGKIPMKVSNEQKALDITLKKIEEKRAAGDKIAYLKEKMYYPIKVDDIFLNEDSNIYTVETAKEQQKQLKITNYQPARVELINTKDGIKHVLSEKDLITEFPIRSQNKDAPIAIYEFPPKDPPFGLYVAGVDPYRQGKAKYSDSLGAVYIYKRMHNIQSEKYQDMFVASYVARPDDKDIWEDQARLLIKYYNARTLCENDDISFIEYMKAKGDSQYLERQPDWLKEVVPNSTVKREYGIHRSSEKIRDHLHTCQKDYLDEKLYIDTDDNGSVISETLGVVRVKDPMLLEEIINYNENDNFDRVIAASLAIALAMHLDPIIGRIGSNIHPVLKNHLNNRKPITLFNTNKRKLF